MSIRKKILIAIIYLIGCVLNYHILKAMRIERVNKWTKGDRTLTICVSACSWPITIVVGFVFIIDKLDNPEPAQW